MTEKERGQSFTDQFIDLGFLAGHTGSILSRPRELSVEDKKVLLVAERRLTEFPEEKDEVTRNLVLKAYKKSLPLKEKWQVKGKKEELLNGLGKVRETITSVLEGKEVEKNDLERVRKFFGLLEKEVFKYLVKIRGLKGGEAKELIERLEHISRLDSKSV